MIKTLRGATLIDGTGAKPLRNSVVVIEDDRISRVGAVSDFGGQLPGRPEDIVDLTGLFVIPGLIQCHEHLDVHRGLGSFALRMTKDARYMETRAVRNALLNLAEGVTTVRDLHCKNSTNLILKQAINEGMIVGCRIYTCGLPIAMTGGHAAEEVCYVADGVDGVRLAARTLLASGVDIVKVMAGGGFLNQDRDLPTASQLTVEEMRAAFDEGHRQGKPTTAHAHGPLPIRNAIEAGSDCIEHGALLDDATAELMAAKGIFLIPTVSEVLLTIEEGPAWGRPPQLIERCRSIFPTLVKNLRRNVEAGIKIAVGTDGGFMLKEMILLHEAGYTNMKVIEAATRMGAEVLCKQDLLGTVEPGKLADMVVVGADPLADLNNLRQVKMVYQGGKSYDPQALAATTGTWPL